MSPQPPSPETWHSGQVNLGPTTNETRTALETWGDLGSDAILGAVCLALVYAIVQIVNRRRTKP